MGESEEVWEEAEDHMGRGSEPSKDVAAISIQITQKLIPLPCPAFPAGRPSSVAWEAKMCVLPDGLRKLGLDESLPSALREARVVWLRAESSGLWFWPSRFLFGGAVEAVIPELGTRFFGGFFL